MSLGALQADEDEQRRLITLKRAAEESGVDIDHLGTKRHTVGGKSYTLDVRTEVPFVNGLVNLSGEDVRVSTVEHPDECRVIIRAAKTALRPLYADSERLMTLPAAIDLSDGERPAPPEKGEVATVANTWQAANNVHVFDIPQVIGFEKPLPRIDRFDAVGVLVCRDAGEALERAHLTNTLRHLVCRLDTHTQCDDDEIEYTERELPRVRVFGYDAARQCLVRYDAQF